ncbi:hypothetical protein [Pedobacter arcticus]|uniref:hypothetical protein n=1 Tax=Pedobacter arcticus TaxID=752140 RepID=UPI0002FB8CAE|nr:hypothetical protein [Pedobacter arcticus]
MESSISFQNMQEASVDEKLNDLIVALNKVDINSANIKTLQHKFNKAIDNKLSESELIAEFKTVDDDELSRLQKLDKIESILKNNFIDTKVAKSVAVKHYVEMLIPVLIGFVMVTLGFAMIILPAPKYFEMFTIFYFSVNDGFTLMDLISLVIVLTGVFVIVKSYFKFANQ